MSDSARMTCGCTTDEVPWEDRVLGEACGCTSCVSCALIDTQDPNPSNWRCCAVQCSAGPSCNAAPHRRKTTVHDRRGYSFQEHPRRVLWFCTSRCLMIYLIRREYVAFAFDPRWGHGPIVGLSSYTLHGVAEPEDSQ